MPKAAKFGYYAVRVGRAPGIYTSWADCEAQVKGFQNSVYKKLSTEADAIEFMAAKSSSTRASASRDIVPVRTVVSEPHKPPTKAVAEDENDCDIVYCDGACKGNGQPGSVAGIGVWWDHGDPRNLSERCPGDQTNNRAELVAIVRVLETTPPLKRRLLIKTDSNYSIQCVTAWIFNWTRNGFLAADGKPVKNRTLIKYLAALLHARRQTSQKVEFKHVRGHVGIEGNEAADQLANRGATKPAAQERDWEKLEREVLQNLRPIEPLRVADDDLKAYADGLLDDDEPMKLKSNDTTSSGDDSSSVREPRQQHLDSGKHVNWSCASVFPDDVSPPRMNSTGLVVPRRSDEIIVSTSKSPSGGTHRVVAQGRQLAPSKATTAISREELEAYASCLLNEDELAALGQDGVFDSDF